MAKVQKAKVRKATGRKTTGRKTTGRKATVRKATVRYSCGGTCTASTRKKHLHRGTEVSMCADGTDVTLRFATSPFVSGHRTIRISDGTCIKEIIGTTLGDFSYGLSCASCPTQTDDCDFIVEL